MNLRIDAPSAISNATEPTLDIQDTQDGAGVENTNSPVRDFITSTPYAISNVSNGFAHLCGCARVSPSFTQGLGITLDTLDMAEGSGVETMSILGESTAVWHIRYPVEGIGYAATTAGHGGEIAC